MLSVPIPFLHYQNKSVAICNGCFALSMLHQNCANAPRFLIERSVALNMTVPTTMNTTFRMRSAITVSTNLGKANPSMRNPLNPSTLHVNGETIDTYCKRGGSTAMG